MTFKDGTTTLGTGTLDASGAATFTTSSLAVGTHRSPPSTAATPTSATSTSAALTQTVNQAHHDDR